MDVDELLRVYDEGESEKDVYIAVQKLKERIVEIKMKLIDSIRHKKKVAPIIIPISVAEWKKRSGLSRST